MPLIATRSNAGSFGYGWSNPLADAGAMTAIATVSMAGGETTATFSSIPSTYDDLFVSIFDSGDSLYGQSPSWRVNDDTGNNYSYSIMGASNTLTTSSNTTSASSMPWGFLATTVSAHTVHILNYANTSNYKTALVMSATNRNNTSSQIELTTGTWRSTSAINKLTFSIGALRGYDAGTVFALYGIKRKV